MLWTKINHFFGKRKAFTLVELLVVIAIIGLLSAITLVAIKETRKRAERARALNYGAQVYHAIGAYLVAEYKFEGNLDDTSGNNNDGTWKDTGSSGGNFVSGVPEIGGEALEFYDNDYVSIGIIPALGETGEDVTITAWIKWRGAIGKIYYPIVTQYAPDFYGYFFYITENAELGFWLDTGEALISPPAGFGNEWYFVGGTYKRADRQLSVYINGVLKGVRILDEGMDTAVDLPAYIASGFEWETWYYFNGAIDEVKIFEEVFTSVQIRKLYVEGAEKRGLLVKD